MSANGHLHIKAEERQDTTYCGIETRQYLNVCN